MYVSLNYIIIVSANGLLPDWRKAINWINADLYLIEQHGILSMKYDLNLWIFVEESWIEIGVSKKEGIM